MLVFGLGLIVIANIVKINYNPTGVAKQEQYYAGFLICLFANQVIEMSALSVLALAIPPRLRQGFWNAGMFKGVADSFGRALGSASFTLFAYWKLENEAFITHIISGVIGAVLFVITILFRKRLRAHNEVKVNFQNPFVKNGGHFGS